MVKQGHAEVAWVVSLPCYVKLRVSTLHFKYPPTQTCNCFLAIIRSSYIEVIALELLYQ